MSSEATPGKWQIVSGVELRWKAWDDEHLVYHSGSGDVHLLNPLVVKILRALQKSPLSFRQLQDIFSVSHDQPNEIQGDQLDEILRQLKKLDLIEPCPS